MARHAQVMYNWTDYYCNSMQKSRSLSLLYKLSEKLNINDYLRGDKQLWFHPNHRIQDADVWIMISHRRNIFYQYPSTSNH